MHGPGGTDYHNRSVFTEVVKPERLGLINIWNRSISFR